MNWDDLRLFPHHAHHERDIDGWKIFHPRHLPASILPDSPAVLLLHFYNYTRERSAYPPAIFPSPPYTNWQNGFSRHIIHLQCWNALSDEDKPNYKHPGFLPNVRLYLRKSLLRDVYKTLRISPDISRKSPPILLPSDAPETNRLSASGHTNHQRPY